MLDIKLIRENTEIVKKALANRGEPCTITMHGKKIDLDEFLSWDKERRKILTELETARARRNKISDEVAVARKEKNPDITSGLVEEMQILKEKIKNLESESHSWEEKVENFLLRIPNIPDPSVPVGSSPEENKVIRQSIPNSQFPIPNSQFSPRTHWEVGESLDILDFKRAAKISGTRFFLYKKQGAVLERALINFMLDLHTKERGDHLNGYQEIFAPYLVNRETMTGTGQLPKFEIEMFGFPNDDLYLIPTAEVSLTNLHRDEILEEKDLPINYVGYSACFRREAGSYGKDTKGLIRNHQFNKVELVKFVKPEDGDKELEKLLLDAEKVLQELKLPYRVVILCTGDLGFASAKTYDLEVWMPGEKKWREVSSCSNFTDFQARRMNIKFRRKTEDARPALGGGKRITEHVYTLNGSGLAVGRTFAAILENYQQPDGTVKIPEVLQPYCGFKEIKI